MSKANRTQIAQKDMLEDHVFRFAIGEPPEDADPLTLVRVVLQEVLSMVELTRKGKAVRVDGFRLLADPATVYPIHKSPSTQEE